MSFPPNGPIRCPGCGAVRGMPHLASCDTNFVGRRHEDERPVSIGPFARLELRRVSNQDRDPAMCPDCQGKGATDTETGVPCVRPSSSCEECFTCNGTGKVSYQERKP